MYTATHSDTDDAYEMAAGPEGSVIDPEERKRIILNRAHDMDDERPNCTIPEQHELLERIEEERCGWVQEDPEVGVLSAAVDGDGDRSVLRWYVLMHAYDLKTAAGPRLLHPRGRYLQAGRADGALHCITIMIAWWSPPAPVFITKHNQNIAHHAGGGCGGQPRDDQDGGLRLQRLPGVGEGLWRRLLGEFDCFVGPYHRPSLGTDRFLLTCMNEWQEGGEPIVHEEEVVMVAQRTESTEQLPPGTISCIHIYCLPSSLGSLGSYTHIYISGATSEGMKLRLHAAEQEDRAREQVRPLVFNVYTSQPTKADALPTPPLVGAAAGADGGARRGPGRGGAGGVPAGGPPAAQAAAGCEYAHVCIYD
jgi:hypothetical protein